MADITILYVSSNKEKWEFESRIISSLLKVCGPLPIVSVTQKPTKLGLNICVGDDIGVSGFNMFRQVLLGLYNINSKFVLSAESDTLYPPDYFTWIPERDDVCYRSSNLYIMPQHRSFFWRKNEGSTCAQIVGRRFYIDVLERLFGDGPMWSSEEKNFPKERTNNKRDDIFKSNQILYYETENPVVQIKTSQSMRHYTHTDRVDRQSIPYWGIGTDFRKKYYDIGYKH